MLQALSGGCLTRRLEAVMDRYRNSEYMGPGAKPLLKTIIFALQND